jgi:4-alpha-glucanotransferase
MKIYPENGQMVIRINTPGSVSGSNWSVLMPCSLEEMLELEINEKIKGIVEQTGRGSN